MWGESRVFLLLAGIMTNERKKNRLNKGKSKALHRNNEMHAK